MTKENFTSINVIIDASGSMQHLTHDTIGGFNGFLQEQKAVPGEAVFTLCTFNDQYTLVHDFVKLASVPNLNAKTYKPNHGTALLDAMGTTINNVGQKLAALPEEERPSKVIFLIITDGEENASHTFKLDQVREMVQHQKDVYSWEFVFMGANIDAIAAGTNMGISAQNTLNYAPTSVGTRSLYSSVSSNLESYRASKSSKADFFNQTPVSPVLDAQGNPIVPDPTSSTPTVK
jgi:hypothetical protein